eukprot:COSAG01_NODE_4144_length_5300_cov_3.103057_4_plen_77_part_00
MPPKRGKLRAATGGGGSAAINATEKGGGVLPWRSARRAAKQHSGGQTSTPSPGPQLEKLSTRESDGVHGTGGGGQR